VAENLEEFIWIGLWVSKLERKSLDMFSPLKDFVEEYSVETSDTGIDQCVEDHLVNLQSRFLGVFQKQEVINTNGSRIHSMLNHPKMATFLLKKKKTTLTLYLTLL
jgi:hypothetical protein